MNTEQDNIFNDLQEEELHIGDLLQIGWANRFWFLISIIICIAGAFLYLHWTPRVYTRTASVLIKDDSKGGGEISESAAFDELNLFNVKRNVDNEVLIFRSKRIIHEVARRLHLDVSYQLKQGLRTEELYTHSPVLLSFPEAEENQQFYLTVKPLSEKEVELSGFTIITINQEEITEGEPMIVAMNDTVTTPIGKVVVIPTLYFGENTMNFSLKVRKSNLEQVAVRYQQKLSASLASKKATIIDLTLEDVSIARAEDFLNTLIAIYNEDAINDKNQITVNTSNFINERLIIIEKELGNVDADIETFKRENQLTDITSETGMYLQNTSKFRQEGLSLDNQLSLAKYIKQYLIDPSKVADLIPANTGISDQSVEVQIGEYNEMLLKRDKLISNSSNKNPVVMNLNNSLNAMRQTIIRSVDNLIVGLNIKIRNVRAQEAQTTRRISAVPTQQKYVLSVERQQKIKEELYLYLLNKREENALSQAITESNARIVDPASGSNVPVTPKSMLVLLVALLLGVGIPSGVLWFMNVIDTKVRTRKDVEAATTIPFLGEIPQQQGDNEFEIVVKESGRDSVSEAFRILRTNMDFMRVKQQDMKTVMFTSFNPGSGKTYISVNLAMSLALTQKKVILVDLDIRKGTLSTYFKKMHQGVTNFLSGNVEHVNDIIYKSEQSDYLDIIFAGPVPPNPAELLLSNRLDMLINELREQYDYVILDNVPAGIVADATIVNRVADLTIYVIRAGKMDRRLLPDVEKLYRQEKFRNMSLVLNGTDYSNSTYGRYGYGYGYGGYGYGYGNDDKEKKKDRRRKSKEQRA